MRNIASLGLMAVVAGALARPKEDADLILAIPERREPKIARSHVRTRVKEVSIEPDANDSRQVRRWKEREAAKRDKT